jgi:hypothetical protein
MVLRSHIHHIHRIRQTYQRQTYRPWWGEQKGNHRENESSPNKVPVREDQIVQRTVHSTSEHDGMAHVSERINNKWRTKGLSQNNPGNDKCPMIVGNSSRKTLMGEIRVGIVQ